MDNVLITTGYNFERYKIVKYLGVIYTVEDGDENLKKKESSFFYNAKMSYQATMDAMIKSLIQKTLALKGNGIIGLQVTQIKDVSNSIGCLVGIATAVRIEKE